MKYTVYDSTTGRVKFCGECPEDALSLQSSFGSVIEGTYPENQFYWTPDGMVPIPASPGAGYVWDWGTKTWQPDIEGAKAAKRAAIEAERDRRIVAPVLVYNGANLDADQRATDNLTKKLAEVNSRIAQNQPLAAGQLVWRDHDNNMLTFADMTSYKNWLDGFAIALGGRGTDAYAWSWQKKSDLDALTTIADVNAFDPMA